MESTNISAHTFNPESIVTLDTVKYLDSTVSAVQDVGQRRLICGWVVSLHRAPCPQPSGGWWSRLSELHSGGGHPSHRSPSGGLTLIPFRSGATLRSFKTTQISEAGFEVENTGYSIYFFIFPGEAIFRLGF